ncbi:hypothetical protein [Streptomyces sp. NPDC127072]|uniref:hypothetical protein n=1 Tax=Streptomyces sp. NPDC127072 TaxID=3347129 RepID=UPI00366186A5
MAFVVAGLDQAADLELAVPDGVGERFAGDDGDVLLGGVDEVAVAAADVVLGIRQPRDQGVGPDVEADAVEGSDRADEFRPPHPLHAALDNGVFPTSNISQNRVVSIAITYSP